MTRSGWMTRKRKKLVAMNRAQVIAGDVPGIHTAIVRPFAFQAADDFADHAVDRQVGAVDDVRVFRDDQRRSAARRIGLSRARFDRAGPARRDGCARISGEASM